MSQISREEIQQMIRQEVARQKQADRFNLNVNPQVQHTGNDARRIKQANIEPGQSSTGPVTLASQKTYRFNTNFTPRMVSFYGNPYHDPGSGIDTHTFVFGQAAFGQNLYFQPANLSSVQSGGTQSIVQSSTMFMALNSGNSTSFQTIASQEHLINVQESGSVVARATVSGYGANYFLVTVDTLSSGWTIVGNFFVS